MSETRGRACLTLAEPEAFLSSALGHALHGRPYDGASIVVQQPGEEVEPLLGRLQKSAHALRQGGYSISDVALVLGARDAARLLNRLAVTRGLSELLAGTPYTLHLISSATPDGRGPLFEFVGCLLANGSYAHHVRLIFSEQRSASGVSKARPRTSHSSEFRAFDLTG